jgi:hypothetical protein
MSTIAPWPEHLASLKFPTTVLRDAAGMTRIEVNQWTTRGLIGAAGGGGTGGVQRLYSFRTIYWATLATALVRNGISPGDAFALTDPSRVPVCYSDDEVTYFTVDPVQLADALSGPIGMSGQYAFHQTLKPFRLISDAFGDGVQLVPASKRGDPPPSLPRNPLTSVLIVNVNQLVARIVAIVEKHLASQTKE